MVKLRLQPKRIAIICACLVLVATILTVAGLQQKKQRAKATANYFATIAATATNYYLAQRTALNLPSGLQDTDIATSCLKTYSNNPYGNQAPTKQARNDLSCGVYINKDVSVNLTLSQGKAALQNLANVAKQEGFTTNSILTNATSYSAKGGFQNSCNIEVHYQEANEGILTDLSYYLTCGRETRTVPPTYSLRNN